MLEPELQHGVGALIVTGRETPSRCNTRIHGGAQRCGSTTQEHQASLVGGFQGRLEEEVKPETPPHRLRGRELAGQRWSSSGVSVQITTCELMPCKLWALVQAPWVPCQETGAGHTLLFAEDQLLVASQTF